MEPDYHKTPPSWTKLKTFVVHALVNLLLLDIIVVQLN